jgi:hypothetical protein
MVASQLVAEPIDEGLPTTAFTIMAGGEARDRNVTKDKLCACSYRGCPTQTKFFADFLRAEDRTEKIAWTQVRLRVIELV